MERRPPDPGNAGTPATAISVQRSLPDRTAARAIYPPSGIGMEETGHGFPRVSRHPDRGRPIGALLEAIPNLPASALAAIDAYRAVASTARNWWLNRLLEYSGRWQRAGAGVPGDVNSRRVHPRAMRRFVAIAPDARGPIGIGLQRLDIVRWAVKE